MEERRIAADAETVLTAGTVPATHAFVLHVAELLHRYGTPSYRFEAAMDAVAQSVKVDGSFLYTPTSLVASLRHGGLEQTYLRRVDAKEVDISKLLAFDQILESQRTQQISVAEAHVQLRAAAYANAPYRALTTWLAGASVCGCVVVLFGGRYCDIIVAFLLGLVLAIAAWWGENRNWHNGGWANPLSGLFAVAGSLFCAQYLPIDFRITALAALILPIPGLSLTIALTELALGHWSAGSARLAGATVSLLTLTFGAAIIWPLAESIETMQPAVQLLPGWSAWVAVLVAPLAFGVLFRAPVFLWPAILATSAAGYIANRSGDAAFGPELGAFCGALAVAMCSNLYARLYNRPAMALLTPGILILVPGSIGYRSITAMFDSNTIEAIELGFAMLMIGISLIGGIVMANVLLSPKRSL